jgi:N-acyl-D-amino-acid deacylase
MCLPPWAVAATPNAQAEKLADPTLRARAYEAMVENGVDYAAIEIASSPAHPEWHGKSVAWLAEEAGKEVRDWTLRALSEGNLISAAHYALSEADVERVLADPRVMIGSDAVATAPTGILRHERPHPRSYGTFVRVLTRYVQERGILSLPEAIRRMTSLPAHRLGWRERGQLAVGNYADIVVFAPENLTENTTFAAPHALAGGIEQVWVNGTLAWQDGHPTGSRTGRVLRS